MKGKQGSNGKMPNWSLWQNRCGQSATLRLALKTATKQFHKRIEFNYFYPKTTSATLR